MDIKATAEYQRLTDPAWKAWGPYVAERMWGTEREAYDQKVSAWDYFPFAHAAHRVYRWGEDGIAGYCNTHQNVCLGVALWNGVDPILKERFFGVSNPQGNHGEDSKEYYFYLDGLPSHAYMKMLYRYPQVEYPYQQLIDENHRRGFDQGEYELFDALRDAFLEHRYFDVVIEYAKIAPEDVLCRITAINRGEQAAPIHVLPQLWYRNTWAWQPHAQRPMLRASVGHAVRGEEAHLGTHWWYVESEHTTPRLLFTENDSNTEKLFNQPNASRYVKDGIQEAVVQGQAEAVNPERYGTKCAAHFSAELAPGESLVVKVRFSPHAQTHPFSQFEQVLAQRITEADEYYAVIHPPNVTEVEKQIQRKAFAGLLWSKQFYYYNVHEALQGDALQPDLPKEKRAQNKSWDHLDAMDIMSVPDSWEYPWFAAWDLVFQAVTLAIVDPGMAKDQLRLLMQERYMSPNYEIPSYEGNFSQANPPIHAWGVWQVYWVEQEVYGERDYAFLEQAFQKLLGSFASWFKEDDTHGRSLIKGGFLGMDNISVVDRTHLPKEIEHLEQADAVGWLTLYCLNMLMMALELAQKNPNYVSSATHFLEHFVYLANLFYNHPEKPMWDEQDSFFYDVAHFKRRKKPQVLPVRSYSGLIPFLAIEMLDPAVLTQFKTLGERVERLQKERPDLWENLADFKALGANRCHSLGVLTRERLSRFLQNLFDEGEFLSRHGLRSVSKAHAENPVQYQEQHLTYVPGESIDDMFGGNSNWRGPIWSPINTLVTEVLFRYHHYYGDEFKVEMPRGSGKWLTLKEAGQDIVQRIISLFLPDENGHRPIWGDHAYFQNDPQWREHVLFYEYFHGESGAGLGASHQNGWTSLVARLIHDKRKHM